MKALFIYKYLGLGGVEAVLRSRLEGLPSLGVDAHVWFLRDGPGRGMFHETQSRIHIGGIHELQRHLETASPDVVAALDTEEALPALKDDVAGRAVVVEIHTPYRENRVYLRWIDRVRVSAFFTPTEYQASLVARATRQSSPLFVIPNPLQSDFLPDLVPVRDRPPRRVVGWVGRLDELKNWRLCLRVAGILGMLEGDIELWLVGTSHEDGGTTRLMQEAERRRVLGRMRWFSGLPHQTMPRFFDMVRESGGIVLSTSNEESFGLSVAEAMARGCAVVVPQLSAFREFVEDGRHGKTYRPGSAKDAALSVRTLLEDSALRALCGAQARLHILEKHAPSVAIPILADALRKLVPST
jgi:glycosyltransferase involved in cell wall biosynthesis